MDHLERLRSWPIENPAAWWEQQQRQWSLAQRRGYVDSQMRRALKHDAFVEHIDPKLVHKLCEGLCGICGEPVSLGELTMDHVVPLSKGGAHSYANIQAAHHFCNRRKSDYLMEEMPDELRYASAPKRREAYINRPQRVRRAA